MQTRRYLVAALDITHELNHGTPTHHYTTGGPNDRNGSKTDSRQLPLRPNFHQLRQPSLEPLQLRAFK
jgi:hypothetical protein